MEKIIKIQIKDKADQLKRTDLDLDQTKEYLKVKDYLIDHLCDAKVIWWIIRELSEWQWKIIKHQAEEN
jgi:hypothetical protein